MQNHSTFYSTWPAVSTSQIPAEPIRLGRRMRERNVTITFRLTKSDDEKSERQIARARCGAVLLGV